MGVLGSINETNDKAIEVGEKYFKTSYKYYKLKIFQQLTITVSMVFKALIIGSLAAIFLLLGAIALSLLIGETLGSYVLGFFIVGLFFLTLSVMAYVFKNSINKIVIQKLSRKYFNENEDL